MSFTNNDQPKDGSGEPSMEEILASIRRILKDEAVKSPASDIEDDVLVLDSSMVAKPVDLSTATSPPPASLQAAETPATPLQSTAMPVHFTSAPTLISPVYTPPSAAPEPELVLAPVPASEPAPVPASEPAPKPVPEPAEAATPPSIFTTAAQLNPAEAPVIKPAGLAPPPVTPVFGGRSLQDYPVLKPEPEAPSLVSIPTPAPMPEAQPAPAAAPFYAAPPPAPNPAPSPAPMPEVPPAPVAAAIPEPAASSLAAAAPLPAEQPPLETKMPETQDNLTPPASLVSDQVTAAAANSIGAMLRSMSAEKSVAISRQSLTIEDMVREEIRPLLKAWLDTNLAGMVERVVRAEIEKVMERSAG